MASRGPKPRPAIDRFNEKIVGRDSGCIEWTGSLNGNGYGTFYAGPGKSVVAHRWSYEHHVGPITDGLQIDHLCSNRKCVNPNHLEPVSLWENHIRAGTISVLNAEKTTCPSGHPYSGENLYIHANTGDRRCRRCGSNRNRTRYLKKKGETVGPH